MTSVPETIDLVHPSLHEEVTAIGGHYILNKEERMLFAGREVLYLVGAAILDTTCCGTGGCGYAVVPGFVREWKGRQNERGLPVSQVEPVTDGETRKEIQRLIFKKEMVQQVRFD